MNPYLVHGPAVISFSGGRTSGYMLRQILDVGLQPDVHVLFSDTEKERPETYDFIREIERQWDFELHRVKRDGGFQGLIDDRKYLPNAMARFCSADLKVKPMKEWMLARGYDYWTNVVGLRGDEPARVVRLRGRVEPHWDYQLPLAVAHVNEAQVMDFWAKHPFDLQLKQWEGNCDLCFLKGKEKRLRIILDRPDLAEWWVAAEEKLGARFRKEHSYSALVREADRRRRQASLPIIGDSGVPVHREFIGRIPPGSRKNLPKEEDRNLALFDVDDLGSCICTD